MPAFHPSSPPEISIAAGERSAGSVRESISAHDPHVGNLSGLVEDNFQNDSARGYALQRVGDIVRRFDDRGYSADGKVSGTSPVSHAAFRSIGSTARVSS